MKPMHLLQGLKLLDYYFLMLALMVFVSTFTRLMIWSSHARQA